MLISVDYMTSRLLINAPYYDALNVIWSPQMITLKFWT